MTGLPSKSSISPSSQQDRQAQLTFHQELTETCVDLMGRYTFSNCGVSPRRSAVTSMLVSQGLSSSWLVGSMILTLTTTMMTIPRFGNGQGAEYAESYLLELHL